jgi:hypothetical protein
MVGDVAAHAEHRRRYRPSARRVVAAACGLGQNGVHADQTGDDTSQVCGGLAVAQAPVPAASGWNSPTTTQDVVPVTELPDLVT